MQRASRVVPSDGLSIWTESFGSPSDAPLLLIMGAMNQGLFWPRGLCERLADSGFFVIRYDHRDTGLSSVVDFQKNPYMLADMAGDALAILDAYGVLLKPVSSVCQWAATSPRSLTD